MLTFSWCIQDGILKISYEYCIDIETIILMTFGDNSFFRLLYKTLHKKRKNTYIFILSLEVINSNIYFI